MSLLKHNDYFYWVSSVFEPSSRTTLVKETVRKCVHCVAHQPKWRQLHCDCVFNSNSTSLAQPDALKVEMQEVRDRTVTVSWSHVFDGGRPIKSYRIDLKSKDGTPSLWSISFHFLSTVYTWRFVFFLPHSSLEFRSDNSHDKSKPDSGHPRGLATSYVLQPSHVCNQQSGHKWCQ